jgi:protein ImuB
MEYVMPAAKKNLDLFSKSTADASASNAVTGRSLLPIEPPHLQSVSAQNIVSSRKVTQEWLAIHLPNWSLDVLQVSKNNLPYAVVESGPQQQIHACNLAAEVLGVVPGMPLNAAYALSGKLQTVARDPQREQSELERLAEWAGRFTPRVSLEPPDGLLLEVKGSLRLFDGADALCKRALVELKAKNIHAQLSIAPTAAAALCLARSQAVTEPCIVRNFEELRISLLPLPFAQLRWPLAAQQLLKTMGVSTIGDCQRLPRDGLARRIRPELVRELDRMLGHAPQVRRRFVPRERFVTRYEFEMAVAHAEQLEYGLRPMLAQLELFLRKRQAAIQALKLTLRAHAGALPPMIVRFAALVWTQEQMWSVLKERLFRLSLSAPVLEMGLHSSALLPLSEGIHSGSLFAHAAEKNPQRFLRLVEQLRARLGEQAVYGLSLKTDHRPELAWRKTKNISFAENKARQPNALTRPIWLLAAPQTMQIVYSRPYYQGVVQFEQGPERIESGWWDGRDVTRDYYIARSVTGQRLWIYRERQAPHGWFLHGFFS